jgi:cobalt-zinc-cadmium resistance protein CzcA
LKSETDAEKSQLKLTENELIKEVKSAYFRLLYAQERIRILQEQDSIYSRFVFLATAKVRSGETNKLEQIQAERLLNENKLEIEKAENELQKTQLLLQQFINTKETIIPKETSLPILDPLPLNSLNPLESLNLAQTPLNQVYESRLQASKKNLSLNRQGYLPDFTVALRNQFLLKGFNPYSIERERFAGGNFMGFEVGVGIPLFFGEQHAKVKAAKKEVERLQLQQENAVSALQKEYETAVNEYYTAKKSLDYYRYSGKSQAEEITRISQLSYENGEIGYIEYVQNLRSAVEIRLQAVDAANEYNQLVIKIMNYF